MAARSPRRACSLRKREPTNGGTSLRVAALLCLLACAAGSGCAARRPDGSFSTATARQDGMSCRQATRIARAAVVRLGYTVDSVEPGEIASPGKVTGRKETGWNAATPEAGDVYHATIVVRCSDRGAEFEGFTDEPFVERIGFRQSFAKVFEEMAERESARRRRRREEAPRSGLLIDVHPLLPAESVREFGADLVTAGVTAVRIEIDNHTAREYEFRRRGLRLVAEGGARETALSIDEAAARFADGVGRTLRDKLIGEGGIAPGATLKGFVYVPHAAYRRATLTLTDRASDETEGFRVEF